MLPVAVHRSGCGIEMFANPFQVLVEAAFVEICHLPDDGQWKGRTHHLGTDRSSSSARDLEQPSEERGPAHE